MILIFSCTTSSDRHRGNLSDAMEKSRDDYEKERVVPDEEEDNSFWFHQDREESEQPDAPEGIPEEGGAGNSSEGTAVSAAEPADLFLLFRGGSSLVGNPHFDNPLDLEILLGTNGEGLFGYYLFGGFKSLQVQRDDSLYESINPKPFILHAGLELRYYPIKSWHYFVPYLTGRMAGFALFWSYRNALIARGDTIHSDSVGGVGFDAGIGVNFIQTESFQAGIQLLPQGFLFGEETSQGFTNDVFSTYGNVRVTAEAGMIF